jgi:hypothetical protein
MNVTVGCQLLERIGPLLRLDHDEEAQRAAQELIDKLKLGASA